MGILARHIIRDEAWRKWFKSIGVDIEQPGLHEIVIRFPADGAVDVVTKTHVPATIVENPPP